MRKDIGFAGYTFSKIVGGVGDDEMVFYVDDQPKFKMVHQQECCEWVAIDDIVGDLDSIIGTPIISATEDTNDGEVAKSDDDELSVYESYTWTFYNISTVKGDVTIKWFGTSNGYYSEGADIAENIGKDGEIDWETRW